MAKKKSTFKSMNHSVTAAKKENKGDERLLKKSEWVAPEQIHGTDETILNSPVMVKAQERILEDFTPKNSIALVSLCTTTRPYSKSRKWKKFKSEFDVDLIISSNGGVIPIEYENCYPFLNYDAHGEDHYDDLYRLYITRNLVRFFCLKKYKYIIFNFRPTLRNQKSGKFAGQYLKKMGHIKDFTVAPNERIYKIRYCVSTSCY